MLTYNHSEASVNKNLKLTYSDYPNKGTLKLREIMPNKGTLSYSCKKKQKSKQ